MKPSILYIQTAFLGDLLLSIPALKALRESQPDRITLLCRHGLGGFMAQTGLVDKVLEIDKSDADSYRSIRHELEQSSFDWVVSPHQSARTAFLVHKTSAPMKLGYYRWWNFSVFNRRPRRRMDLPEALRQLALVGELNPTLSEKIDSISFLNWQENSAPEIPEWASMELPGFRDLRRGLKSPSAKVQEWLQPFQRRPLIALAPGSVWRTKMWTEAGFAKLGEIISKRKEGVIIIGAPDEKEICTRVAKQVPGALNLAGQTSIWESAECLALCDLAVTNDSGAMHLAAVAGTPSVSVFGPTTLELGYRPWNNRARVVELPLGCRPCGSHGGRRCPLGTHACMTGISPERVWEQAKSLL